jgi:hypothetical protein
MKEQDILSNITSYETTGKLLTHPHVMCSCCNGSTTMFGNKENGNLYKRIQTFGSLRALLTQFKCRACSKGHDAVAVKAAAPVMKATVPVIVDATCNVEYASASVQQAALQMSAEDCAKVFVAMPDGKLDYWWRHPEHATQRYKATTGVTVTVEGRSQYFAK